MHPELKRRLKKLNTLKDSVDAIMIFNLQGQSTEYVYFTGTDAQGIFLYDFSKAHIFTNVMEAERAKKSWVKKPETKGMKDVMDSIKGMKIGLNFNNTTTNLYKTVNKRATSIDISTSLESARSIKTAYEIKCIRKACNFSKKSFQRTNTEGKTEIEVAASLEKEIKTSGCAIAFDTIVASGKNIKIPHHKPTTTKALNPLLIDFGAKYRGYCADITRTCGGRFKNLINKVFEEVEENLLPGAKAADIDAAARKKLGKYEKFFITSLGHGIGLDVHERPWISGKSADTLLPGMTFTIEPGIYINNGIRIENDYVITKKGLENLTNF